ncbi:MAG: hypothetical protein ACFHWZ_08740 [Phycisphaerales bacterium]
MAVDVVVGDAGGEASADRIGHLEDGPDVGRREKNLAVVEGKAFAGLDLRADGVQTRVGVGGGR